MYMCIYIYMHIYIYIYIYYSVIYVVIVFFLRGRGGVETFSFPLCCWGYGGFISQGPQGPKSALKKFKKSQRKGEQKWLSVHE